MTQYDKLEEDIFRCNTCDKEITEDEVAFVHRGERYDTIFCSCECATKYYSLSMEASMQCYNSQCNNCIGDNPVISEDGELFCSPDCMLAYFGVEDVRKQNEGKK